MLNENTEIFPRAPILEAVIEVRFTESLTAKEVNDVNKVFKKVYPFEQQMVQYRVQLNVGPQSAGGTPIAADEKDFLWRRSANDEQEVLIVGPLAFGVSQLAPYQNWASFFGRFQRDWNICVKKLKRRKIARVGLRYINRIDIPVLDGQPVVEETDYFNIFVKYPDELGPFKSSRVNLILNAPKSESVAVINAGSMLPAVPKHASFLLDIDIGTANDVPLNDEAIFGLLDVMRQDKNIIFNSCVTEKAKGLFR